MLEYWTIVFQLFHEKYKWLETAFYLVIGILPGLLAVLEMVELISLEIIFLMDVTSLENV